jgi:peptide/nickel transport system substrate-binding protein
MKRLALAALVLSLLTVPALAQDTPRMGGVLKAAMIGEPPSLDLHWTTAVIVQQIMWHVYETLYTYDKNLQPVPMLAESHAVADGGRRYTITLRKNVKFHNGKEMTSADVVPSLQRWGKMSTTGKALWKGVEAVEAKDPYTVVIHLKEPSGSLLFGLGSPNNGAAIYPKDVMAAAGEGQIKEFIGTGPYRFVEHKPDRHIKLARFNEYAARSDAPDGGYGGKRVAYFDEILFIPVPDEAVRLAGVETGEYHYAQSIKSDQHDRVKSLPALEPQVVKPYGWITAVPNHKQGVMANKKVRQAFLAALDMEPIMSAAIGNKAFYRLDGALFFPEQAAFHSQAGVSYSQRNPVRAKALLAEAGYKGEPVRWITTKEYDWMYNSALVAKQQMEAAGFVVDLRCWTGPRWCSGATSPSSTTSSPPASRSGPIPRSPRRSSATGRAGGATRRRSAWSPRCSARPTRRSGRPRSTASRPSSTTTWAA